MTLLILAQSTSQKIDAGNSGIDANDFGDLVVTNELSATHITDNIRNRYSYFYARVENGLCAPLAGLGIAFFVMAIGEEWTIFNDSPAFSSLYLVVIAIVLGIGMLWRIPQLFREIDDLEILLIKLNYLFITKLFSTTPQAHNS